MNWPLSRTSANRASSSERTDANWALTSTRGICCTRSHFSGVDEIRRQDENACNDGVFDVLEVAVEVGIARAQSVADAGEREAPDRRSHERQERVRAERHPEDAGRNRDERTDDRSEAADENANVPPPVEPAFGTVEIARSEVQPTAPALDERTAAASPRPPADQRTAEIAEGSCKGDHDEGADPEADLRAEERDVMRRRDRTGGERAADEHHEL